MDDLRPRRMDTWALNDNGEAALIYPRRMTATDLESFEAWLLLTLQKIKSINAIAIARASGGTDQEESKRG